MVAIHAPLAGGDREGFKLLSAKGLRCRFREPRPKRPNRPRLVPNVSPNQPGRWYRSRVREPPSIGMFTRGARHNIQIRSVSSKSMEGFTP